MDKGLGMHPELGLALHRERLAEAERDRSAREAEPNATHGVAFVVVALGRWIENVMSGVSSNWRHDFAVQLAIGSVSAPR